MQISIAILQKMAEEGEKIAALACYDYSFARLLDESGLDILIVGDSLGMTIQGHKNTLKVSIDEMVYHTKNVMRGVSRSIIVSDMPFGSYQQSCEQAFENAVKLMQAGANLVKLEGGEAMASTVSFLAERGIPVCSHIGLTPQSLNKFGGFFVQGKDNLSAKNMLREAKMLDKAGASMIVIECVPAPLAKQITDEVSCPTIGIGSGVSCDGQVLVLYDILGIGLDKKTRFTKNFMLEAKSIESAVVSYVKSVKSHKFPSNEHCF